MAQLIWSQRPERRQMETGIFTEILKNCPCGNLLCPSMLQWGSLIPRAALLKTFLPAPDSESILLRTSANTVAFWTDVSHTTQKKKKKKLTKAISLLSQRTPGRCLCKSWGDNSDESWCWTWTWIQACRKSWEFSRVPGQWSAKGSSFHNSFVFDLKSRISYFSCCCGQMPYWKI